MLRFFLFFLSFAFFSFKINVLKLFSDIVLGYHIVWHSHIHTYKMDYRSFFHSRNQFSTVSEGFFLTFPDILSIGDITRVFMI